MARLCRSHGSRRDGLSIGLRRGRAHSRQRRGVQYHGSHRHLQGASVTVAEHNIDQLRHFSEVFGSRLRTVSLRGL
jgi:hypothetical protein